MRMFLLVLPFLVAAILQWLVIGQWLGLGLSLAAPWQAAVYAFAVSAASFGLSCVWSLISGERGESLTVEERPLPPGLFGEKRTNFSIHHQAAQDGVKTRYDGIIKDTWMLYVLLGLLLGMGGTLVLVYYQVGGLRRP